MRYDYGEYCHLDWHGLREALCAVIHEFHARWDEAQAPLPECWEALEYTSLDIIDKMGDPKHFTQCEGSGCDMWVKKGTQFCSFCRAMIEDDKDYERLMAEEDKP